MRTELTPREIEQHNELVTRGWAVIEGEVLLQGTANGARPPGWLARRRLRKASRWFRQALAINPAGWESMWALGKICQRLREHRAALTWFAQAHQLEPGQPDVAREAGLAALACGEAQEALRFCSSASENAPPDAGLLANLALAHMLCGNDTEAVARAGEAVRLGPEDPISTNVSNLVRAVAQGERARPTSVLDGRLR